MSNCSDSNPNRDTLVPNLAPGSNRISPRHPNTVQRCIPEVSLPAGDPATVPGCHVLESNARRDIRWCCEIERLRSLSHDLQTRNRAPSPTFLSLSVARRGEGYGAALRAYSVPLRLGSIPITALPSATSFVLSIYVRFLDLELI